MLQDVRPTALALTGGFSLAAINPTMTVTCWNCRLAVTPITTNTCRGFLCQPLAKSEC